MPWFLIVLAVVLLLIAGWLLGGGEQTEQGKARENEKWIKKRGL